jgi:hypothetical protein
VAAKNKVELLPDVVTVKDVMAGLRKKLGPIFKTALHEKTIFYKVLCSDEMGMIDFDGKRLDHKKKDVDKVVCVKKLLALGCLYCPW